MFNDDQRPKASTTDTQLVELLDRVLERGVVVHGEISISVANVDLIFLGLNVLLTSIDKLEELRKEGYAVPFTRPLSVVGAKDNLNKGGKK